jgi:hypothetical protein
MTNLSPSRSTYPAPDGNEAIALQLDPYVDGMLSGRRPVRVVARHAVLAFVTAGGLVFSRTR